MNLIVLAVLCFFIVLPWQLSTLIIYNIFKYVGLTLFYGTLIALMIMVYKPAMNDLYKLIEYVKTIGDKPEVVQKRSKPLFNLDEVKI